MLTSNNSFRCATPITVRAAQCDYCTVIKIVTLSAQFYRKLS